MTDAQLVERYRLLNRERQKRFYDAHREQINAKRREIYKAGRAELAPAAPKEPTPPPPEPQGTLAMVDLSKAKNLSYQEIRENLAKLHYNSAKTAFKYQQDFERLHKIANCEDYLKCFKKPQLMFQLLENAKQTNGRPYSINTIKSAVQTILFIIDRFELSAKVKKDAFRDKFEALKIRSLEYNAERQKNEKVLPFQEYLSKVKDTFGEDSKMYVIARMYDELTVRDDFVLKIIHRLNENDGKTNYIVIPQSRTKNVKLNTKLRVIINSYKTRSKYGVIDAELSVDLSNLIRKYAEDNHLQEGQYLFGDKELSNYVSARNRVMGIQGSITLFRQMKISDEVDKDSTDADARVALANKLRHSPVVQLRYLRKH